MFFFSSNVDIFFIFAIIIVSMGFSAFTHYNYSFLHFLLVFESIILAICLIFAIGASVHDKIEGDVAILFIVAIVAAETAIAISLYIRATINPPMRSGKSSFLIKNKKVQMISINKSMYKSMYKLIYKN